MKQNSMADHFTAFFKDKDGKVVITQWPNIPIIGWLAFKVLSMLIDSANLKNWFENLSLAFLFTFAYLEITSGASYFRRLLGLVVMVAVIMSYYARH